MDLRVESHSPSDTMSIARRVGGALRGSDLVLLDGEMGSGKTVFAKGLYLGLGGVDPDQVVSPSYTLVNLYLDAGRPVYHVDLYRLDDPRHLLGMEYEDFLYLNEGLTIVEWPAAARELLEEGDSLEVRFAPGAGDGDRVLTLSSAGERYAAVFDELGARC